MVTLKKPRKKVESFVLYRILKVDFEYSALIKTFSLYGGLNASNGGLWRSLVVVNGRGGGLGFWVRVWRE